MKKIIFGLFLVLSLGLSVPMSANSRYEKMKKNSSQENLGQNIREYSSQYPEEFEPMVDLAVFFTDGDFETGISALKQAEEVYLKSDAFKNPRKHKDSFIYAGRMYAGMALCHYRLGDLKTAKAYIDKSYEFEVSRNSSGFLKGVIDYELGNFDEAWKVFKETYKNHPDYMYDIPNKYFMTMAAEKNDFVLAEKLLDRYLEMFPYYPGLGDFASDIYLKTKKVQKSVLCKFLELEYESCFTEMSDEMMRRRMVGFLQKDGIKGNEEAEKAFLAVVSLYDKTIPLLELNMDFFAWDFLRLKYHLSRSEFHEEDIGKIMEIKKYMEVFPSFHWIYAENMKALDSLKMYYYTLEKIISFWESVYEKKARRILFNSQTLGEEDFGRFLIPFEVQQMVKEFLVDSDDTKLEKVYDFLQSGNCLFLFDTVIMLSKICGEKPELKSAFEKKLAGCPAGRLRERLEGILAG